MGLGIVVWGPWTVVAKVVTTSISVAVSSSMCRPYQHRPATILYATRFMHIGGVALAIVNYIPGPGIARSSSSRRQRILRT